MTDREEHRRVYARAEATPAETDEPAYAPAGGPVEARRQPAINRTGEVMGWGTDKPSGGKHGGKKDPGTSKPSPDGSQPAPDPKHKKGEGEK